MAGYHKRTQFSLECWGSSLPSLSYSVFLLGLIPAARSFNQIFFPFSLQSHRPKILLKNQMCARISEVGIDDYEHLTLLVPRRCCRLVLAFSLTHLQPECDIAADTSICSRCAPSILIVALTGIYLA
jgi:hypothetical protein